MLVAADIYRPAAIEQLKVLAVSSDAGVHRRGRVAAGDLERR